MADFTVRATACVPISYFTRGFLHSHNANRRSAIEDVVEADPVAARIRDIMAERTMWMFQLLRVAAPVRERRIFGRGRLSEIFPSACPPAPAVRRAQTPLRARGIEVTFGHRGIGADGADNAAGTSIRSDHRVFEIWSNAYDLDIGIDA
jgi:hypothetical protein